MKKRIEAIEKEMKKLGVEVEDDLDLDLSEDMDSVGDSMDEGPGVTNSNQIKVIRTQTLKGTERNSKKNV